MSTTETEYDMDRWEKPERLPGGVAIPTTSRRDFYHYFMNIDGRIWEMTQSQRETWKNEIINNWDEYRLVLYRDGTGAFHQQLKDMHRMGGAIILVAGDMGVGKSIISTSICKIWNVLNKSKEPIHIFWSKSEVRAKIRKTDPNTAHLIDEDMKSTGSGSANLLIHLKNLFESLRKTGKLVLDVGVNAQPSNLGRAVGLQIFPIGFNREFQANRFIVCNWKGEPLWIAFTQRFYFPEERAYYEGELGYLGEYPARVLEFSNNMTGVFSGSNAFQEKAWSEELVKAWKDSEWAGDNVKPPIDVLEFLAIQIEIPSESIASIRRVCAVAKMIIGKSSNSPPGEENIKITEAGWEGFRQGLHDLSLQKGISERDAEMFSLYHVPKEPKWTYSDVGREMGLSVLSDTIGTAIRRRKAEFTTKEIGDLGEKFVTSQLDILGAVWGGGGDDTPDVRIGERVFNVKTSLSDSVRKYEPTTPENKWADAYVILLLPRLLECRLYPITGEHTMLNGRKGRLVATENLAEAIEELMLVKDNDKEEGGDKK